MDEEKIKQAFLKVKQDISEINNKIEDVKLEVNELRKQLRELLREVLHLTSVFTHKITSRTTTRTTSRSATRSDKETVLKSIQKRILKNLDIAQLMKAIKHYIEEGYRTNQIRNEVIIRFNIGPTCFFKYLKLVREQLREVTTRSNYVKDNT